MRTTNLVGFAANLVSMSTMLHEAEQAGAKPGDLAPVAAGLIASEAAIAAEVERLFRAAAARSMQSGAIGQVAVVGPELARAGACIPVPQAALLGIDVTLNYDWGENVALHGLAIVDRRLVLSATPRPSAHAKIYVANVLLLRADPNQRCWDMRDPVEHGIAAVADGHIGYAPAGSDPDGALAVAVARLIRKLHRRHIRGFDADPT